MFEEWVTFPLARGLWHYLHLPRVETAGNTLKYMTTQAHTLFTVEFLLCSCCYFVIRTSVPSHRSWVMTNYISLLLSLQFSEPVASWTPWIVRCKYHPHDPGYFDGEYSAAQCKSLVLVVGESFATIPFERRGDHGALGCWRYEGGWRRGRGRRLGWADL